jgi:REP element-mobilizing transposase RayT
MKYNPQIHHRRSIRLKGYDYASEGIYFVTICTLDKKCLFGEVIDGEMRLNELGKIVRDEWMRTPEIRPDVALDRMVVMPNHLHGIVLIQRKRNGDNLVGAAGSLRM